MSKSKLSLFSQVLSLIDRSVVGKAVQQHDSDKYSKGINTWTHFVSMIFMQIAELTSLRDISNGLMSATGNLNHLGITKAPRKSSMSYINKHRTFEVFQDIYFKLLDRMEPSLQRRRMYARHLKRKIFIMDASCKFRSMLTPPFRSKVTPLFRKLDPPRTGVIGREFWLTFRHIDPPIGF